MWTHLVVDLVDWVSIVRRAVVRAAASVRFVPLSGHLNEEYTFAIRHHKLHGMHIHRTSPLYSFGAWQHFRYRSPTWRIPTRFPARIVASSAVTFKSQRFGSNACEKSAVVHSVAPPTSLTFLLTTTSITHALFRLEYVRDFVELELSDGVDAQCVADVFVFFVL